jgi:hypothetical protein
MSFLFEGFSASSHGHVLEAASALQSYLRDEGIRVSASSRPGRYFRCWSTAGFRQEARRLVAIGGRRLSRRLCFATDSGRAHRFDHREQDSVELLRGVEDFSHAGIEGSAVP